MVECFVCRTQLESNQFRHWSRIDVLEWPVEVALCKSCADTFNCVGRPCVGNHHFVVRLVGPELVLLRELAEAVRPLLEDADLPYDRGQHAIRGELVEHKQMAEIRKAFDAAMGTTFGEAK